MLMHYIDKLGRIMESPFACFGVCLISISYWPVYFILKLFKVIGNTIPDILGFIAIPVSIITGILIFYLAFICLLSLCMVLPALIIMSTIISIVRFYRKIISIKLLLLSIFINLIGIISIDFIYRMCAWM